MDSIRRPCFIEEDDGLASIERMEAGFSGNFQPFFARSNTCYSTGMAVFPSRKGTLRSFNGVSGSFSPRSVVNSRVFDGRFDEQRGHFLEACFLCKKPLSCNRDIFMYRGDTPFCSEECRQEQIERDEAKEKKLNMKALRSKQDSKNKSPSTSSSPTKSQNCPYRTGTVAAA